MAGIRTLAAAALLAAGLAGCGGDDEAVTAAGGTAEDICNVAAADGTVAYDTTGLVRAKTSTRAALASWMENRNGPNGPHPSPEASSDPDRAAPVTVCVFRANGLAPPVPPGTPPATGVSVILAGTSARMDAMGDANRIAAQLDGLH